MIGVIVPSVFANHVNVNSLMPNFQFSGNYVITDYAFKNAIDKVEKNGGYGSEIGFIAIYQMDSNESAQKTWDSLPGYDGTFVPMDFNSGKSEREIDILEYYNEKYSKIYQNTLNAKCKAKVILYDPYEAYYKKPIQPLEELRDASLFLCIKHDLIFVFQDEEVLDIISQKYTLQTNPKIGMTLPSVSVEPLDELTVNAHSVSRLTYATYDIIFVQFDITNNSINPKKMSYSEAILTDINERKFTMIGNYDLNELGISKSYSECPRTISISDINPGITKEYSACFQIPKDSYAFSLKISGIYGESYQLGYERQIQTKLPSSKIIDATQKLSIEKEIESNSIFVDDSMCGSGTIMKDGKCVSVNSSEEGGGCLIATAIYGSEMSNEVQQLRELRDNQLLNTASGTQFMSTFNDIYYSFSPTIADMERENPYFKEAVKLAITPMISSLSLMENAESESEVLGIGIFVIMLNLGMYLGIPAIVIVGIKKRF